MRKIVGFVILIIAFQLYKADDSTKNDEDDYAYENYNDYFEDMDYDLSRGSDNTLIGDGNEVRALKNDVEYGGEYDFRQFLMNPQKRRQRRRKWQSKR